MIKRFLGSEVLRVGLCSVRACYCDGVRMPQHSLSFWMCILLIDSFVSDSPASSHQSRWCTKWKLYQQLRSKRCESHNISHSRFHIHAVTSVNEYANVCGKKKEENNKNENCKNEWIGEQTDQLIIINANDEPPQKRNEERERTEWASHDSRSHFMLIAHWKLKHFHGNRHRHTITHSRSSNSSNDICTTTKLIWISYESNAQLNYHM